VRALESAPRCARRLRAAPPPCAPAWPGGSGTRTCAHAHPVRAIASRACFESTFELIRSSAGTRLPAAMGNAGADLAAISSVTGTAIVPVFVLCFPATEARGLPFIRCVTACVRRVRPVRARVRARARACVRCMRVCERDPCVRVLAGVRACTCGCLHATQRACNVNARMQELAGAPARTLRAPCARSSARTLAGPSHRPRWRRCAA
jgi:hypothetical protein